MRVSPLLCTLSSSESIWSAACLHNRGFPPVYQMRRHQLVVEPHFCATPLHREEYGAVYYFNAHTKESSWSKSRPRCSCISTAVCILFSEFGVSRAYSQCRVLTFRCGDVDHPLEAYYRTLLESLKDLVKELRLVQATGNSLFAVSRIGSQVSASEL